MAQCAQIMLNAVKAHAAAARSLRLVRFVLFGDNAFSTFDRAAREMIPSE
jgi:hypothetical protein